jgi:hypothetical protein
VWPRAERTVLETARIPSPVAADGIARKLIFDLSAAELLACLDDAHAKLCKDGHAGDAGALGTIVEWLVPWSWDWDAIDATRKALRSGPPRVIELPARTEAVAEIILAGAKRRSARFRPSADRPTPRGQGALLDPLPGGIDAEGRFAEKDLYRGLAAQLTDWVPGDIADERELAKRVQRVLAKIRRFEDDPNRPEYVPHYVLVKDDGGRWNLALTRIVGEIPSLLVVRLDGRIEDLDRELDVEEPLGEMLRRGERFWNSATKAKYS